MPNPVLNLDLSRPRVMAILNATPDSFYAGSRASNCALVEQRIREVVSQGAYMVDIGGCSTRPGAEEPSPREEYERVAMALEVVRKVAPEMPVSIDTFRASVFGRLVEEFGPLCVNDISGGERDPELVALAAERGLPYVAMHMRGDARTMQQLTAYEDVVQEVVESLSERLNTLREAGIKQVVLDPGFGFAKSLEQNYRLLGELHRLVALGAPVLAALSRKSMIYRLLETTPDEALMGSVALQWEALRQGATLLRVHDVKEAVDLCRLYEMYKSQNR